MSTETEPVTSLECDECGGDAVTKPDGIWEDGELVTCECGAQWLVSLDTETPDVWLNPVEAAP